jgi:hypothetical protein
MAGWLGDVPLPRGGVVCLTSRTGALGFLAGLWDFLSTLGFCSVVVFAAPVPELWPDDAGMKGRTQLLM